MDRTGGGGSGALRNISWAFVARTFDIAVKLAAIAVLTRVLGASDFGQFVWILSTTALLVVFSDLGASSAVARFLADAPAAAGPLLRRSAILVLCTTTTVILALVGAAESLAEWLEVPWLVTYCWYVAGALAVQVWLRFLTKAFEGLAQQHVAGRIQLLAGWLPWMGCILAVTQGYGISGALSGYIFGNTILCVWLAFGLRSTLESVMGGTGATAGAPDVPSFRLIVTYAVPLVATSAGLYIFTSSDILILQIFRGSSDVGIYGAAVRLIDAANVLSVAVGSGLAAHFVRGLRDGHSGVLFRQATQSMLSVYLPLAVVLGVFAPELVSIAFGKDYEGASLLVRLYLPYFVLKSVTPTYSLALDYMGEARRRALAISAAAIANVLLNLWLVPTHGGVGAALATQVTYIPVGLWYAIHLFRRCGGSSVELRQAVQPAFIAAGLMFGFFMAARSVISALWLLLPLGGAVYLGILWRSGGLTGFLTLLRSRRRAVTPGRA